MTRPEPAFGTTAEIQKAWRVARRIRDRNDSADKEGARELQRWPNLGKPNPTFLIARGYSEIAHS